MKKTEHEREIEALYKSGSIKLTNPDRALMGKLGKAAGNTFRKDRRINIRISEHDMVGIQKVAATKGVPYQSLISGLIHQYVEGDLKEKTTG
jgi:predicted DNA binding CopG/RHH family protein